MRKNITNINSKIYEMNIIHPYRKWSIALTEANHTNMKISIAYTRHKIA